jgi:hypothetical protein
MKRNIRMDIKRVDEEENGEVMGWDMEEVEVYRMGYMDKVRDLVKKIHWDEFLKRNFQEKIMIVFFFILILFLISILVLRFYWKKIK